MGERLDKYKQQDKGKKKICQMVGKEMWIAVPVTKLKFPINIKGKLI